MPQRTNPKQQVIEMLKALLAPQGCKVTASKFLVDTQLASTREVDVVAEMEVDGHVFTQSFEVVGRGRPMDLTWVEGMVRKHQNLPTDRLYLVSWSGFSEDALRLAQMTSGVFPVTVSPAKGAAKLYANQVTLNVKRASPRVRRGDGGIGSVISVPDLGIYSQDGELRGTVWQLGTLLLRLPVLGQALLETAHAHPRRGEMRWFEAELPLDQAPLDKLFLRFDETADLHRIIAINLQGDLDFSQQTVDLRLHNFTDHIFGHGEAMLGGQRHLIVASFDHGLQVDKVKVEPEKGHAASSAAGAPRARHPAGRRR